MLKRDVRQQKRKSWKRRFFDVRRPQPGGLTRGKPALRYYEVRADERVAVAGRL